MRPSALLRDMAQEAAYWEALTDENPAVAAWAGHVPDITVPSNS